MRGPRLTLHDKSTVGVIGGGPAGSFFSYFLLEMAETVGLKLTVDIYEPRDFAQPGPGGCNMCGGIVSESLVQALASEGVHLGHSVVQRSIDSYCLHMDVGDARILTPLREKTIASVYRGGGPHGMAQATFVGLDAQLLKLAQEKGAHWVRGRVDGFDSDDGRPRIGIHSGGQATYDLIVVAVGVNSTGLRLFEATGLGYKLPRSTKSYICEFCLGRDMVRREFGYSMHVFLLDIPRLEFAALIPKGDYITLCMLGKDIDKKLVNAFLDEPVVKQALPPNWTMPADFCHCAPKICVASAKQPFGDRIVFVGDCGTTRLYKDGIGAAYRTSKAAARTAIFHGVSAEDFRRHYWPVCKAIRSDNAVGRFVFAVTRQIQHRRIFRRGLWRLVSKEQKNSGTPSRMSGVLWDTFTGSAPYKSVLMRSIHPAFLGRFAWEIFFGGR